jgi:acyl-coenzyme A synthetase/AMP-(fatty) acid ligase
VAQRIVLCPPDLLEEHARFVAESAETDVLVTDMNTTAGGSSWFRSIMPCSTKIVPADCDRMARQTTEWILLTSGTTGVPKMVVHNLKTLARTFPGGRAAAGHLVLSTFYDIRRYGGLYAFLRVVWTGGSLVLSNSEEPVGKFLDRTGTHNVTLLSGSPSLWRRALMSPSACRVALQHIRVTGEVVDQTILDHLRSFYPQAKVIHAFASTEAGLAFEVTDGLAGFPASYLGQLNADVELKIKDGSLRIRSTRAAVRYLGNAANSLTDADGFVDTGDMVERRGDRYYFVGRRDAAINVGGLKFYPEEVEAVIHRHPQVRMVLVRARKSSISGALVVADIVLEKAPDNGAEKVEQVQREILQLCRNSLLRHKVPAIINIVPELAVAVTGKMERHHA